MIKLPFELGLGLLAGGCTTFAGATGSPVGGATLATPACATVGTTLFTED